jgi:hypothetical protein
MALLCEAAGIGGVQVVVGGGMAAGVGIMQGRAMRDVVPNFALWFCSSTVGLALPFLIADISRAARWDLPYSLYLSVAAGGLIAGLWQSRILRPLFQNAGIWVAASSLGWTMAGGTVAVADQLQRSSSLRGVWGAVAYLGIVAAGGLILGLVTGMAFVHLRSQ